MQIEIRGNHFRLLSQKAVFWEETQTLLIGDLHLGKIIHFRKEGIAVPGIAAENNFLRLNQLVQHTGAVRIIFLGDLFHSKYNSEWETFRAWRAGHHYIEMIIVIGNHDILPVSLFLESDMQVYMEDFEEDGFIFTHHPKTELRSDRFVFAGHVHPVFTSYGKGRQSVRLPCFVIDKNQAILPSFGVFTGGYPVNIINGRKIYITTETTIFPVC
ncbi:ligase-associated DNA damage response endonuclease PdeM [Dyadobacter sediminis]|uniref:Ligase-associated DNA damage response endonuclease PdeM n=1 Tax=Dyadobacter sediminis TaxID=1493691 RepID=A0A5R9K5M1_9BACT|nr:ligase-associated DNA damage response endonuclease PdeM [Dyadobacter sediminis]TLU88850.1 ligase-associated DNA damage response endonuclease PdeM [Dyadobacter sediminis]GGC13685.1 DEAD/DEAH box helicase [Dyadobacter sediminis]